jgi:signal transduction histidine kinase
MKYENALIDQEGTPAIIMMNIVSVLGSHRAQISFILISAFFCFFPIYSGIPSSMEVSILRESLMSGDFRESSYATLSLCLVFAWDSLIDHFDKYLSPSLYKENRSVGARNEKIVVDLEKVVYFLGVLIVPVVAMCPMATDSLALVYACATSCQLILLGGCMAIMCSRYYPKYFPRLMTIYTVFCFPVVTVVQVWVINRGYDYDWRRDLMFYLQLGTAFPFFVCIFIWAYYEFTLRLLIPRARQIMSLLLRRWRETTSGITRDMFEDMRKKHSEDIQYFPAMYTVAAMGCLLFLVIGNSLTSNMYDLTPDQLLVLNLPVLLFQISMMVFSSQFSKYEAVENLYALLDSKKSYVRYISHELRTPMNTACLGLNLLLAEVGHRLEHGTAEERTRFETLTDINVACNTAVDILNDLLSFEKLESGILELHKEDVPALSFVNECVGMFAVHAKSKNIHIASNFLADHSQLGESVAALLPTDIVNMDRFKMSQVLRNLVSNALKFTPKEGTVTVKAYYKREDVRNLSSVRLVSESGKVVTTSRTGRNGSILLSEFDRSNFANSTREGRRVSRSSRLGSWLLGTKIAVVDNPVWANNHHDNSQPVHVKSKKIERKVSFAQDLVGAASPSASAAADNASGDVSGDPSASVSPSGDSDADTGTGAGASIHEGVNEAARRSEIDRADNYDDDCNDNGFFVIEVIDTGAGISKANQQKLFKQVRHTTLRYFRMFTAG